MCNSGNMQSLHLCTESAEAGIRSSLLLFSDTRQSQKISCHFSSASGVTAFLQAIMRCNVPKSIIRQMPQCPSPRPSQRGARGPLDMIYTILSTPRNHVLCVYQVRFRGVAHSRSLQILYQKSFLYEHQWYSRSVIVLRESRASSF